MDPGAQALAGVPRRRASAGYPLGTVLTALPAALTALLLAAGAADALDQGRALASAGDWAGAAERFRRAVDAFPTWGLAQIELAEALTRTGADEAALDKALGAARSLEPLNPRVWVLTGRRHEQRGEAARALEAWGRAVDLRPDLVDARDRLGVLLCEAGRPGDGATHLKVVVEARPDDRTARANLADALERAGDLGGAERHLRALADGAPKNLAYRRRLVDFLERSGKAEAAAAETRKMDDGRSPRKLRPLPASGGGRKARR